MPRNRPAGYSHLIDRYRLEVLPNWHTSTILGAGVARKNILGDQVENFFPPAYWPGEELGDHLAFALKYDGVNLGILYALFEKVSAEELCVWIAASPTGKFTRRIWFLYEFLTGRQLPLEDLKQGNYFEVLEPDTYFTVAPGRRVPRMRITDNLLGNLSFCPVVRRTAALQAFEENEFKNRCDALIQSYPTDVLKRAQKYLYTKETKSSFEIEHLQPGADKLEKFVALLEMAEHRDYCDKDGLVEVQNRIVDPRFQDSDYRSSQNYVGESLSFRNERIHYICPKPEDLPSLMDGLIEAHRIIGGGRISPIVHATIVSYGFVFLHPFEDGNGRIHRFLIHNILSLRGLTPKNLVFPISATMLKQLSRYDQSLEAFSQPLTAMLKYELDEDGRMRVIGATARHYRFMDMTSQTEALFSFLRQTLETELVEELRFLANYDKTKRALKEIVDMPDRLVDLFIRFCHQNNGCLSAKKRAAYFPMLKTEEIGQMEQALNQSFSTDEEQQK